MVKLVQVVKELLGTGLGSLSLRVDTITARLELAEQTLDMGLGVAGLL